jgi:adenosylcobinamide-phosphate synthase
MAAAALAVWAVTGARSLHHEAERAMVALARNDLPAARRVLPSLCGRDPAGLDATELTRAVIESVAENTSDAVVAPLLWGAVAGLPGLAAYRAVNTLDAMVGYRSSRYLRYGWASARLDDVANWVPARVTAALTIACAPVIVKALLPGTSAQSPPAEGRLVRGPVQGSASALRAALRDGPRHPSPNAGRCEAAFAGALGLRLGGTNVYGGVAEVRPELGEGRAPEPDDIRRAIRLSRAVTASATALAMLIAVLSRLPVRFGRALTVGKVSPMPDKVLYTAEVVSTGDGRNGHVLSSDHRLDLDLSVPTELDGPGGPGTNPEQLFAAGYAACFHSALRGLARSAGVDASHSTVTAQVGVGPEGDMFGLVVTLVISIPSLDQARTRELAEAAHQRCPYSRATRGNISVELRVP